VALGSPTTASPAAPTTSHFGRCGKLCESG
jgi:hypothetical protein